MKPHLYLTVERTVSETKQYYLLVTEQSPEEIQFFIDKASEPTTDMFAEGWEQNGLISTSAKLDYQIKVFNQDQLEEHKENSNYF